MGESPPHFRGSQVLITKPDQIPTLIRFQLGFYVPRIEVGNVAPESFMEVNLYSTK